jgi:hypothetical protein
MYDIKIECKTRQAAVMLRSYLDMVFGGNDDGSKVLTRHRADGISVVTLQYEFEGQRDAMRQFIGLVEDGFHVVE